MRPAGRPATPSKPKSARGGAAISIMTKEDLILKELAEIREMLSRLTASQPPGEWRVPVETEAAMALAQGQDLAEYLKAKARRASCGSRRATRR